jgi:hypothetical protein
MHIGVTGMDVITHNYHLPLAGRVCGKKPGGVRKKEEKIY